MYLDWEDEADCKTLPAELVNKLFFPGRSGAAQANRLAMREVCSQCPVQPQCLDRSQTIDLLCDDIYGSWGGLTEPEIRLLRRGRLLYRPVRPGQIGLYSQQLARAIVKRVYRHRKAGSQYQAEIQPFIERYLIWRSQTVAPPKSELVS